MKLQEQIRKGWTSRQIVQHTIALCMNTVVQSGTHPHRSQVNQASPPTAHSLSVNMMPMLWQPAIWREISVSSRALLRDYGLFFNGKNVLCHVFIVPSKILEYKFR
jgi:hypothetical protein